MKWRDRLADWLIRTNLGLSTMAIFCIGCGYLAIMLSRTVTAAEVKPVPYVLTVASGGFVTVARFESHETCDAVALHAVTLANQEAKPHRTRAQCDPV